jgi:DHA1 family bicyclomycin/chloramphenicol resistance-like MFS transporter
MARAACVTGRIEATSFNIALMTAIASLGQFATNIYIPSLPAISDALAVSQAAVQLTLVAYLAPYAVAQLVYGPISDRIGRKPVVVAGLLLFLAGTALGLAAHDIATLMLARIVQAIGAAAGLTIGRAIVRDSFDGVALTRAMTLIAIASALAPGLTPLVGGVLQDGFGWRASFALTFLVGAAALALMHWRVPETLHTPLPTLDLRRALAAYRPVIRSSAFRAWAIPSALTMAALFAFFTGAAPLFISHLAVSPTEFGLYPPLAVIGFVIGGLVVRRRAGARSPSQIASVGLVFICSGAAIILLPLIPGIAHKHIINLGMIVFVTGLGIVLPVAIAAALQPFADRAGTAAAMIGFLQMGAAAISAALVAVAQPIAPLLAFPLVMGACAAAAAVSFRILSRRI